VIFPFWKSEIDNAELCMHARCIPGIYFAVTFWWACRVKANLTSGVLLCCDFLWSC